MLLSRARCRICLLCVHVTCAAKCSSAWYMLGENTCQQCLSGTFPDHVPDGHVSCSFRSLAQTADKAYAQSYAFKQPAAFCQSCNNKSLAQTANKVRLHSDCMQVSSCFLYELKEELLLKLQARHTCTVACMQAASCLFVLFQFKQSTLAQSADKAHVHSNMHASKQLLIICAEQ